MPEGKFFEILIPPGNIFVQKDLPAAREDGFAIIIFAFLETSERSGGKKGRKSKKFINNY